MLAAGLAAAALTLPGAGVVKAAGADGGALAVSVTANLPQFPCASCTSTASGSATGVVVAVDASTKKAVAAVFAASGYNAQYTYHEACPAALNGKPVPPPEGFATGTFVTGPSNVGGDFLTGSFNYTRVGLTAVITTTNNQLHQGSPSGPTVGPAALGASVGIFVPLHTPGNCTAIPGPAATIGVESVAVAAG